ncbi:MAG: TRAM domain-containing protein [Nanoarchaeota archaeon]
MKEGEELDVKIEAIAEKGDGIAKKEGFVIFVPGVNIGDEVRIRVTKVLRRVAFSERIGAPQGPVMQSRPKPAPKVEEPAEDSEDFGEEPSEETKDFGDEPKAEEPSDDSGENFDDLDAPPAPK